MESKWARLATVKLALRFQMNLHYQGHWKYGLLKTDMHARAYLEVEALSFHTAHSVNHQHHGPYELFGIELSSVIQYQTTFSKSKFESKYVKTLLKRPMQYIHNINEMQHNIT